MRRWLHKTDFLRSWFGVSSYSIVENKTVFAGKIWRIMKRKHMYLLEQEILKLKQKNFRGENIVLFHINHFLDNSLAFNQAAAQIFEKVVFLGVPYHSEATGVKKYQCWDYPCYYGRWKAEKFLMYRNGRQMDTFTGDYDDVCKSMLETILREELLHAVQRGKQILVLEDGGYLCQFFEEWKQKYPQLEGSIIGSVEQTTSGMRRSMRYYGRNGYEFPCISVSRSDFKMDVEALFIGSRIVEELERGLYDLDTFMEFHQVLLLGYGVLGRVIADILQKRRLQLTVYDIDPGIRQLAREEGYSVVDSIQQFAFHKDTVVLGVTGEESFTIEMLEMFRHSPAKRMYLASGSSKQIEFRSFLHHVGYSGPKGGQRKSRYTFSAGENEIAKQVYLLAEGMPLNFYKKNGGSLTFSVMDFIFTEMLLCGCSLLRRKDLEKRMYLAGRDEVTELDEALLFHKWCKLYGLLEQYPGTHPAKEYLRGLH